MDSGPEFVGLDEEKGWRPLSNSKSEWIQVNKNYENIIFTILTFKGSNKISQKFSARFL